MKAIKCYAWALIMALTAAVFTACNDDDPKPTPKPDPTQKAHFDLWVAVGEEGGMGSTAALLVKSTQSLDAQTQFDFKGSGVDVTKKLYQETIIRGKYYYQIPQEKDRFGKYQIVDAGGTHQISIVKEVSFKKNTLKDRRYTHAWINDHTLVLIGSNGKSDKILWIKIDTENMTILDEGELDLPAPPDKDKFNTSGIANYRDGKILYAFVYNNERSYFQLAFINASDMKTEKVVKETRAEFMAGTAYGELLQHKSFFTPNGDYYLACNSVNAGAKSSTQQHGALLRIKKGATEFDKSYRGYNHPKGKIVTADCLSPTKALLYIQDPEHTGAKGWGADYNCYYAILDLTTDQLTEIQYNGTNLPFSSGTFSQRSLVLGNKAYIGVNPKDAPTCIYIYDIPSGQVTKGMTIAKGYHFERIVGIEE